MTTFRQLNDAEQALLERLLSVDFPGRTEIKEQIRTALARTIDENRSFELLSSGTPQATVVSRIPVEGEGKDIDGVATHALLHVVDGKIVEVEIYRVDGARIQQWPSPDTLELFAPGSS